MANTVTIGWGKPTIVVRKSGETSWQKFATPVEDSTQLEATQGDKLEAPIEGGTNEAVKYKKNTYALTFDVRQVPERTDPIEEVDGVVDGEFEIGIIPENEDAIGAYIKRAACNVLPKFDTQNGTVNTYNFDVLQPDEGKQVERGKASQIIPDYATINSGTTEKKDETAGSTDDNASKTEEQGEE
jgi:hypothetical protein